MIRPEALNWLYDQNIGKELWTASWRFGDCIGNLFDLIFLLFNAVTEWTEMAQETCDSGQNVVNFLTSI